MKKFYKVSSIIAASCFVLLVVSVMSVDGLESRKAEEMKPESVSLFNGKDLTGWKTVGGNGVFQVEDGCIVGKGVNVVGNTFLRTEKTYTDFELTYEFKFDHLKNNSGVMFRAEQKPSEDGNGIVFGYQSDIDNKKERAWTCGLYDEKRRGWLHPRKITKKEGLTPEEVVFQQVAADFTKQGNELFKWDDWNTMTIRCEGNHIQTFLNGVLRVDFTDTDEKHDTREGFIGLQVHQGRPCKGRWRNIILADLSSSDNQ